MLAMFIISKQAAYYYSFEVIDLVTNHFCTQEFKTFSLSLLLEVFTGQNHDVN